MKLPPAPELLGGQVDPEQVRVDAPQLGAQLGQSALQQRQVLLAAGNDEVDVGRQAHAAVGDHRPASDDHVVDLVCVEHPENPEGIARAAIGVGVGAADGH